MGSACSTDSTAPSTSLVVDDDASSSHGQQQQHTNSNSNSSSSKDVFLGGACGATVWRNAVIPLLLLADKTFYNPQVPSNEWHEGLMAEEMTHKATSAVLLFVIGRETRAVASIAEAAFYIGVGRDVVIVLQPYPETMETLDESLDLNRGRRYLRQIAEECSVRIFDTPVDAIRHIISMR